MSYEDFFQKILDRVTEYPEIIYHLQLLIYGDYFRNQNRTLLKGHSNSVYDVTFKNDGRLLASASRDKTVRFWRKKDDMEFQSADGSVLNFDSYVWSVRFSKYGFATGDADGFIKFWTEEGVLIKSLQIGSVDNPVLRISFSLNDNYVAAANLGNDVQLWKIELGSRGKLARRVVDVSGEPVKFPHGDVVYDVCFSPDSQGLTSAGLGGSVKYWEIAQGSQQTPQEFVSASSGIDYTIYQVSFSHPNGLEDQMIASANSDGTVNIWRFATRKLLTTLPHSAPQKSVFGVRFSPDGRKIASAGEDGTVKLWSVHDGKLLRTYWHGDAVNRVCFSPDGQVLASACADGKVGIFYQVDAINEPKDAADIEQLLRDGYQFFANQGNI